MQKEYYLLAEDRRWLEERIAAIEKEIQDMGPAFHEALNQTSETWHDNAPFDALREYQSVLQAEIQKLKGIRRASRPGLPAQRPGIIGIGSLVEFEDGRHIFLAGHWTYRAGEKQDNAIIVSVESPIGQAVLGKKVADETKYGIVKKVTR